MYEKIGKQVEAESLFEDLLEQAYLESLIDGEQQSLAYVWRRTNPQLIH